MSDLRQAASFALSTLQGWSGHDHWRWPESALAQAKQNTTEAISLLEAALAEPEPKEPTDEELLKLTEDWPCTTGERHDLSGCPEVPLFSVFEDELIDFARVVLARWGK